MKILFKRKKQNIIKQLFSSIKISKEMLIFGDIEIEKNKF